MTKNIDLQKRELLKALRIWRDEEARREGVESYRVFPNATLEALAVRCPLSLSELLEVKGIKEGKQRRYGKALLAIIGEQKSENSHQRFIHHQQTASSNQRSVKSEQVSMDIEHKSKNNIHQTKNQDPATVSEGELTTFSVGQFLDAVNLELSGLAARVRGEVSSVEVRERVVYFTLKDGEVDGTLNCLIFRSRYDISGVTLSVGDEVIVEGVPEIYKPNGRFNLRVGMIELAGEGALKKAYDALKKKLEGEGVFDPEKKRSLPTLIERIALITSSDGAAIGDFTMNLGRNGIRVDFYPTAVEGKKAVFEILEALQYFARSTVAYDCLVIIRGGGSLESLQAFNNEALVRAVAESPVPVLAGIGHEKDVTLVALAADRMVSTPTATARTIGTPWEEARVFVSHAQILLVQVGAQMLEGKRQLITDFSHTLEEHFENLLLRVRELEQSFRERYRVFPYLFSALREKLIESERTLTTSFTLNLKECGKQLEKMEASFRQFDPERLLALGYSLVRSGRTLVRSASMLKVGERLSIQFKDGGVESEVIRRL